MSKKRLEVHKEIVRTLLKDDPVVMEVILTSMELAYTDGQLDYIDEQIKRYEKRISRKKTV